MVYINEGRLEKEMFVEKKGDAELAELFALGLIAEPEDNGTLILVPCADPVMCEIHGTYWIEKRIKKVLTPTK